MRIYRSRREPLRTGLSTEQMWKGQDRGLIICWEVGRKIAEREPALAERARKGELPPDLGWKGGVAKRLKKKEKIGTLFYLAQWQGLRGDDLDVDLSSEPELYCTRTGMKVIFTANYEKYANA